MNGTHLSVACCASQHEGGDHGVLLGAPRLSLPNHFLPKRTRESDGSLRYAGNMFRIKNTKKNFFLFAF